MVLSEFKFLIDENMPSELTKFLVDKKYDVKDVKGEYLFGTSDIELFKISQEENRVIVTQDKDFGKIIFTTEPIFTGIIYLKPGHISGEIHINTFRYLLEQKLQLTTPFILVVENNIENIKIRIRNELKF